MPRSYVIEQGDALDRIAAENNTTRQQLLELNRDITDPNKIYAGRTLNLPDAAPMVPATPVVAPGTGMGTDASKPAPFDYGAAAKQAGAGGLSLGDYSSLFGATPEEQKASKDSIAKNFGYADSDAFYADVFQKPSKNTEQFYREAYGAAGLAELLAQITSKKAALNKAIGTVNDNPWYDEAFRRGEASRLQELAGVDIQNLQETYDLSHDQVKQLVARFSDDLGTDEKVKSARFNYLENAAKEASTNTATTRTRDNLSQYLAGKTSAAAPQEPKVVSVGEGQSAYQWNPTTRTFELFASKPKTYAPAKAATTKSAAPAQTKTIASFRTALASRTSLNRAGTREQFIRELQAKFPNIEPSDIARAVYETYPDNFDQTKKK
jgi:LysM repeat protein